ncbi:MAG: hypothetical protein IIT39_13460 [Clostridia bacterium]|nr:hypothetical protein [Clostridia bacterium]
MSSFRSKLKKAVALSLTALTASAGMSCLPNTVVNAQTANTLSNINRGILFANSRTDFRDESIYFVITTRFYDGDPSNNARTSEDTKAKNPENDPSWRGDFKGLIDKLDYIKALGFTAIWITPVVENNSGYDYHGYHAYDFSAVDKRYESNGVTYQTLIDACHAKGMKVIQDIVLNHTCNWGERNLLQLNSDVYTERNKAIMNGSNDPENIYHHNGFCGGGDWDEYAAQNKTIADDCFDLETENPKVYNYLKDCYVNYINMGVDGFRVDTVKHISRLTLNSVFVPAFKQAGGENFYMFGEVCTKGHDVWYRGNPPISTSFYTWAEDGKWANCWTDDLAANESLVESHYTEHKDTSKQPTSTNAFLNGNEYHTPDYSMKSGLDSINFQMHWSFNDANSAFYTALGEDKYFNDSTWNVVYVDSHDYGPDQSQTLRYNGGTGYYNYAVLYKRASQSNWTTVQNFSANDTVSFKPQAATDYDVCIKVKDTNGNITKKYFTVEVTNGELANNSKISATSITLGNTVTLTGSASGGTGSYKYAVYYKSSSSSTWNTKQDFNSNNTTSIKFSGKGTKNVCIKVKDSSGTVVKKYFTVTVK